MNSCVAVAKVPLGALACVGGGSEPAASSVVAGEASAALAGSCVGGASSRCRRRRRHGGHSVGFFRFCFFFVPGDPKQKGELATETLAKPLVLRKFIFVPIFRG